MNLAWVGLVLALAPAPKIAWEPWSDQVFERARAEQRFVLLDLGAVWCHWCHVMEETTYQDPAVVALIQSRYVAVRVDQDARPDLSNRYEDYGWPATVVFAADGSEIVKFQGYIPPGRMVSLLRGIIDDPTPGPSVSSLPEAGAGGPGLLTPAIRERLVASYLERYDHEFASWGTGHKYLEWDSVEYSLALARAGDAEAGRRARATLDAARKLIDPVWGGVYQYSDSSDWDHPHFEKIMAFQAEILRSYALAYAQWHEPRDLQTARDIQRFLVGFLRGPEGAFYVSQDADVVRGEHSGEYFARDDAGRRLQGVPRVDAHLYTRENGWAIRALLALYGVTGEPEILEQARTAANWILENRALPGGGFRHDANDAAGPYLSDTLAAGRALLDLYAATGERQWLVHAEQAAGFIAATFAGEPGAGFATARPRPKIPPRAQRDENIGLARFANLLGRYTGKPEHHLLADQALGYLARPEVATRIETAGVLLAADEVGSQPVHVTVVANRNAPEAQALLRAALALPGGYKRVELWDRAAGPLPNPDVAYPALARPAAFVCAAGRCSRPLFTPEGIGQRLAAGR